MQAASITISGMRKCTLTTEIVFGPAAFDRLQSFAGQRVGVVTGCTVAGVVFSLIAFLFLLNAWLKGLSRFVKNKAVF